MKKLILTLSTIILVASLAVCQDDQGTGDAYINQMSNFSFDGQQVFQENDLLLIQTGANNQARVSQSQGQAGAHSAAVIQFGIKESVVLSQSGANNQAAITQFGYNNSVDVAQTGNFSSSLVIQNGWNNNVEQELGASEASFTVIQNGANWGVIDTGFNANSPGYTIKQEGLVGVTVTVQHQ